MSIGYLNITSNFINALTQFLISIALSKYFSPEFYGEFVYTISIAYMVSVGFNFGYHIFGLVFFSKKYYNILKLLVNYSYLILLGIVVFFLLINKIYLALASVYVFLLVIKELINTGLVTENKHSKKFVFNLFDFSILATIAAVAFLMSQKIDVGLYTIFTILILNKAISLLIVSKTKSFQILKPLPLKSSINHYKTVFSIVRYNSLNVFFTNLYTQGYFIVIGELLSFTEVSLIKYITLIQSNLNIVTNSLIQIRSQLFKSVKTKLQQLYPILSLQLFVQLSGVFFSFLVVWYFNLFELLFNLKVDNYFLVAFILLSYSLTPIKQTLSIFLTSKNFFLERTKSIIYSVLISFPLLLLLKLDIQYIILYFFFQDLSAILFLNFFLKRNTK